MKLTQNMRVYNRKVKYTNNIEFHQELENHQKWLLNLGENCLPKHGSMDGSNIIKVPEQMCHNTKGEVQQMVYDNFKSNIGIKEYFKSRILLAAKNEIVDEVNAEMVKVMKEDEHILTSVDTVGDFDSQTMIQTEYLNSLNLSGLPKHELKLKKNTAVILLRNMDIKAGHCNGTRYLVKEIGRYRLLLEKSNQTEGDKNTTLLLQRIPMRYGGKQFPFELKHLQFPIKIAFALTINRSQGLFVSKCGILLPKNVWTHGQIYVAFSRCGNPKNIYVWVNSHSLKSIT